ncbi:hypothetical protein D3C86_2000560 [compost metagenome]
MQLQRFDAFGHRVTGSRQEARAHAIGDIAQPQVEAGRLHLIILEWTRRDDGALLVQQLDQSRRKDALRPRLLLVHAVAPHGNRGYP